MRLIVGGYQEVKVLNLGEMTTIHVCQKKGKQQPRNIRGSLTIKVYLSSLNKGKMCNCVN